MSYIHKIIIRAEIFIFHLIFLHFKVNNKLNLHLNTNKNQKSMIECPFKSSKMKVKDGPSHNFKDIIQPYIRFTQQHIRYLLKN